MPERSEVGRGNDAGRASARPDAFAGGWHRARLIAAVAASALLAACASRPDPVPAPPPAPASPQASVETCAPPPGAVPRADYCTFPPDVRAFLDDRDLCDHFRGEPWPEGDTAEDRERRRQLVDGVRTACAGTDRQLDALLERHRGNAAVMQVLAGFERNIEGAR